jgi:gamma-glutamyltranspeptidase/glutathione hydrolase
MTGIGGDMFCLFYEARTKKVHALNGSGRSPASLTLDAIRKELGVKPGKGGSIPMLSTLAVTTPGAAAGWVDTFEKFGSGKLSLEQVLTPAIELGEEGFPVSELSAKLVCLTSNNNELSQLTVLMQWKMSETSIRNASPNFREMLKRDRNAEHFARAPRAGELFYNPNLAKTFRTLAAEGKTGFYTGRIAQEMVDVLKTLGGYLSLDDLKNHAERGSELPEPISLKFKGQNIGKSSTSQIDGAVDGSEGVEIWEHPPNGQGIVALMALGMLEELEKNKQIPIFEPSDHNSAAYLHAIIEVLRIAFADANWWVTDPSHSPVKPADLISPAYLAERAKLFSALKPAKQVDYGKPGPSPAHNHSDTVYFSVTDAEGNGVSFINSNYGGFGTCIVPKGCGFTMQNRGANFVLGPKHHPNIWAPGKRPYHTIIPGLITAGEGERRELHSVFGNMGGFMQPQGHVQLLMNMEVFGMNPQQALDAPRLCIAAGTPEEGSASDMTVYLEEGIREETVQGLRKMGHQVEVLKEYQRGMFGRGQIIRCHKEDGRIVYSGGSDPRGDGCAMPV